MDITFEGKNILISGAAGFVGSQLVKDYSESDAELLLILDTPDRENELKELKKKYEGKTKIKTYTADLRKVEEIKNVADKISNEGIGVDILVNNAGVNILKKVEEMDEETWDLVVNLNLKGSFFLTKEIGTRSLVERKGNIIFISSQHGVVGNEMRASYCSSKSGILGLVRSLTADWSPYGVRVNAVSPTYILNKTNEKYLMGPRGKRNMLKKIPLYKYAETQDISNAVLFLSSDKASMITGHNLVVDGGYTSL